MVIKTTASFAALFLATCGAHASPGALEINQACVAEGCFPGDDPGFPVEIRSPGNYILTSNLNATAATGAIVLIVDNINLDLGGFHVRGPANCYGNPVVCDPGSLGHGVNGTGITMGSTVKNGSVSGFEWGVATDPGWRVTNVTSSYNRQLGFFVRRGAIVRDSLARFNAGNGFQVGALGQLIDSISVQNNQAGVTTSDSDYGGAGGPGGAHIERVTLQENGIGIYDHGRSRIMDCSIHGNHGVGIESANGGSLIAGNTIIDNEGVGLHLNAGGRFATGGLATIVAGNSFSSNNSDGVQIDGAGPVVVPGPNLCGTATCP